jgi:DNA polymerase III alpha subunit
VAGVVIAFQRPPTARGFTFVTLEDESGRVQIIVPPRVYPHVADTLRSRCLVVSGRVQRVANWRGLVLESTRTFVMNQRQIDALQVR